MIGLQLRDLTVRLGTGSNALTAVEGVDLDVPAGRAVGLVGESGSGKSTLARAVVGLIRPSRGQVMLDGEDVTGLRKRSVRRRVQLIFQDPYASLNPRMTVAEALGEAIRAHRRVGRREIDTEIRGLLDLVSLDLGCGGRLPREMSGGQRQRVAIARALAVRPDVLIADEITAALDASVQGAILNLIRDIRTELGLTVLFISHNLAVVRYVCDAVAVMYLGQIVERAPTRDLITSPRHPYTRALLAAVPRIGEPLPEGAPLLDEEPPDPHAPPSGCRFHTRCPIGPVAVPDRRICTDEDPHASAHRRPHRAACHFAVQPAAARHDR